MAARALTVNLPGPLCGRLARRATSSHRTVEAELVNTVAAALDALEALPSDLAEAVAALHLLGDAELWRAARQRFATDRAERLESLHLKRQREGLSAAEFELVSSLMQESTRVMLVRARAAAVLAQRGHDVSSLLLDHEP